MGSIYATYQVPQDVDKRVVAYQRRVCDERALTPKQFSKAGDAMREILALAEAAQRLGLRADTLVQLDAQQQAQP